MLVTPFSSILWAPKLFLYMPQLSLANQSMEHFCSMWKIFDKDQLAVYVLGSYLFTYCPLIVDADLLLGMIFAEGSTERAYGHGNSHEHFPNCLISHMHYVLLTYLF